MFTSVRHIKTGAPVFKHMSPKILANAVYQKVNMVIENL